MMIFHWKIIVSCCYCYSTFIPIYIVLLFYLIPRFPTGSHTLRGSLIPTRFGSGSLWLRTPSRLPDYYVPITFPLVTVRFPTFTFLPVTFVYRSRIGSLFPIFGCSYIYVLGLPVLVGCSVVVGCWLYVWLFVVYVVVSDPGWLRVLRVYAFGSQLLLALPTLPLPCPLRVRGCCPVVYTFTRLVGYIGLRCCWIPGWFPHVVVTVGCIYGLVWLVCRLRFARLRLYVAVWLRCFTFVVVERVCPRC